MQISQTPGGVLSEASAKTNQTPDVLMQKAKSLEAIFLAEMFAHAGLGSASEEAFAGGIGEEQFASFLRQEQAAQVVQKGGIGLAEHLFRALTAGDAA